MKNLASISNVLTAFYNGTIESVRVSFIHEEKGIEQSCVYKNTMDFIEGLPEIYDYGFEVEYNVYNFAGDEVELFSEETDKAMQAFGIFMNNYSHDFIEKVWGKGAMGDHMQSKWNEYRFIYGAEGVVRKFYTELSINNRSLLNAYIAKNH